jgi:predicted nucleotidyltransferase component of viral defense system
MTLDISVHKTLLFKILKDIYADGVIAPFLGFKGGTAALMFYGLDRFSVDLDFDLLDEKKEDIVFERVIAILHKYGTLKEAHKKRFTLFCLLSYEDAARNIKVEINRRDTGSSYEIKTYLGVSMVVMKREDMVANKLLAMYERAGRANRDIYDMWFFLSRRFPIHKALVEQKSGVPFPVFVKKCITRLESVSSHNILDRMGELLTPKQKAWVKAHLIEETISLLKLRAE